MPEIVKKYKEISKVFVKNKFTQDGSGWLFLQQLIIAPMSLITTVLLAKVLSIADYGYYKYILSVYAIVAIFGLTGFYNIASLNIQRGEDEFFNIGFKYRKLLRWIPVIITLFISVYYFYKGNNFFGTLFLITIFSHLFVDLYDFYTVGTMGKGDYKLNAKISIINYFVSFFPPILVAHLTHNLYYVFICLFICQFLVRIFAFNYVKNKFNFKKNFLSDLSIDKNKNFRKESLQLSFNNGLVNTNVNASNTIVFNRLGAESTAIYSIAISLADFVYSILSSPLSKTLLVLSRMTKEGKLEIEKINYIKTFFKKYFFLSVLGMVFCIIALPFVYKFLFAKYLFSYKYAVVYSLSIISLTFLPAYQYFFESRKIRLLNVIQIVTLISGLFTLFFASMYFGLWGAIIIAIILRISNNFISTIFLFSKKT